MMVPLERASAVVQSLPFYDSFAYSEGQLYTVASGVWDAGGNAGAELTVANAAVLLAPPGLTNALNKGVKWTPSGTARRSIVQFNAVNSGTLYASFLVNIASPPSSGSRLLAYFDSSTSQPSSPQLGFFVSDGAVGIGKKTGTPGSSVSVGSGTHFVVVRYTFTGTTTDQVDLWVNPAGNTFGAGSAPDPAGSTSGGNNGASIPYFGIYAASGAGPNVYIDEVRIGTTWASVTPASGAVQQPPASGPLVTQTLMSPAGVILRGTNGAANGTYRVLGSTNVVLPVAQWSVISTQSFSSNGSFAYTNPLVPGTAQQFFRLVSGANTNPPVGTPPGIISQPQNQFVAEGQGALFSIGASGSTPLSYQWYFNTNTPISGATSSSYQISSVTPNDAGGYSVIITNSAGSTNSIVATLTVAPPPTNGDYYVSTTGNDANPGTLTEPFATVAKAVSVAQAGDLIYVRGGTYFPSQTINIATSGTPGNLIKLWAYPGEQPILDFVNQPYGDDNRGFVLKTNGNYWHFKGLEIARAGDNAIKVEGSHSIFELLVLHHNGDSGLQIGFGHPAVNNINLAAFITVINCDSYANYDPNSNGGDADGFAAKLHCGQGIVFMGCRAWENSDDGWDLFETDASVVISNCWTWRSAPFGQGNGNGFKLGGDGTGGNSMGTHYAYNCVSFGHKVNGFTQNSHRDGLVVQNCLSFSNGNSGYNYYMEGGLNSGKQNIFRNNVSIPRTGVNGGGFIADNNPVEQNNSWNLAVTASTADYLSVLETAAKAARKPDGSLPDVFGRLVAGSDLIDKGVDVGWPFNGTAPDLGPYEFSP